MTENSTEIGIETEVKEPKKQGKHINKKAVAVAFAIVAVFMVIVSILNGGKEEAPKVKKTGFEEKITTGSGEGVSDLPTSYADIQGEDNIYTPVETDTNDYNENVYYERSYEEEVKRAVLERLNQEAELAKRSGIGFKVNLPQNQGTSYSASTPLVQDYDLNRQESKKDFLRNEKANPSYLSNSEEYPVSPYEVKAGTIIPGVMITGINSDLPGHIVGQVRENVFDTVSGNCLLIPQGTKIFGTYDANVTWGQDRALIVWQRLIFPNGKSITLENMPGVDLTGQAGFRDKVNHHYGSLLKGVLLSSIAGAGAAIVTEDEDDENDTDFTSEAGKAAGLAIINIGNKFADKALERQPTIEIRPGYRFNIMVHRDMILNPYE